MENLDIEKLSREMPYKLPENTFESMQNNVLAKTLNKKQVPIFNLKWLYAAAAIILLIVSANFIVNSSSKKISQPDIESTAKIVTVPEQKITAQTFIGQDKEMSGNNKNAQVDNSKGGQDLTLIQFSHPTVGKQIKNNTDFASVKNSKINHPTEAQIDSVLDGFSSSEIASLSNNTEQDVYLDLYN